MVPRLTRILLVFLLTKCEKGMTSCKPKIRKKPKKKNLVVHLICFRVCIKHTVYPDNQIEGNTDQDG